VSHGCPDLATLLAYWFGELDGAREAAIEEHYFGCALCTAQLAEVEALGAGVRRAFAGGRIGAVVTPAFIERLRDRGLRLREYRVPCNGSVNCSVGADDDLLLSHLQVPLEGVERLDLLIAPPESSVAPAPEKDAREQAPATLRLEDVPFDLASGEVVLVPGIAQIRTLPAYRQVMRLVAVGADGDRVLGEYVFNHSPQ
jgi:hypothetical protein